VWTTVVGREYSVLSTRV